MNGNNVYAKASLPFLHEGTWKFSLHPAEHHCHPDDAMAILELEIYGFEAAVIMTGIYVNPYGFHF